MWTVLSHALAILTFVVLFAAGGYMYWQRASAVDILASRRAWYRAFALCGFGGASVSAAAGLGVAQQLILLLMLVWAALVAGMFVWWAIAQTTEEREAHRRNAALGWPRGKPPLHPAWSAVPLAMWITILQPLLTSGLGPGSWLDPIATSIGIPIDTAGGVVISVSLATILLGLACTVWLAVRRILWSSRGGSVNGSDAGGRTSR